MRAFIYKIRDDGTEYNGVVSPQYKSYENMERYFLNKYLHPGTYKIHLYNNWDNRYKHADKIYTFIKKEN